MLPLSPTELVHTKTPDYHWSPANQRGFLEALSTSGNITESAKAVSMSAQAAYTFCERAAGRVFKLGWDAAVLVARRRIEGELLERAMVGQEETYERDPDTGRVKRTRIHNGTTMAMLTRLDRMASGKTDTPADTAMAQVVAQDFERFLDLVESGGGGAEAMLFLKARDGALVPMAGFDPAEFAKHYQLSQKTDICEAPEPVQADPVAAAAKLSVWYCDDARELRTNFPPDHDFTGYETGSFGDRDYQRELSKEEQRMQEEADRLEMQPFLNEAQNARDDWFGTNAALVEEEIEINPVFAQEIAKMRSHCADLAPDEDDVWWEEQTGALLSADTAAVQADAEPASEMAKEAENSDECPPETQAPAEPEPVDNPNVRVIHCKPQPNYLAMGIAPPWAERIY
jgi:hypothetical protein